MNDNYCATLYPSRLCITPKRKAKPLTRYYEDIFLKADGKHKNDSFLKNFKVRANPFIMSKASKRKIFDSINSMFVISPPRRINMKNNKQLYNFRLNFITLTLPSNQEHSDTFIKSECLNHLLTELRKFYQVKNYVWKAELQQNENIHFHLITDQYIDYQALRRRWNRILDKHGYIKAYQEKMQALTLTEYHELRNKATKCDFKQSAKAYAAGQQSKWRNPNSVDVRQVMNKKDLAIYLAKYIAKTDVKPEQPEELTERQINFGRSWSRSYSLAQLHYKNKFELSDIKRLIEYFKERADVVRKYVDTWCEVYYFNAQQLSAAFQKWHRKIIVENCKLYQYPIPAT